MTDRGHLGLSEILGTFEERKEVLTQVPFLAASWLLLSSLLTPSAAARPCPPWPPPARPSHTRSG